MTEEQFILGGLICGGMFLTIGIGMIRDALRLRRWRREIEERNKLPSKFIKRHPTTVYR